MNIIDGKNIARQIIDRLKTEPRPAKKLVAVFVGNNPASASFLKQKEKIAQELAINFQLEQLSENISEEDLKQKIKELGDDPEVGGIIIQLPLPPKFDRDSIIGVLNPEKDIDALTAGTKVLPLAVLVVIDALKYAIQFQEIGSPAGDPISNLKDKIVAVVGRGILVGKPIAEWLKGKCLGVAVFHSGSDLTELKSADLVITGVGKAGLIKPDMLKVGAGVIDFGFDMVDGKIRGDFDSDSLNAIPHTPYPSFYTPTPGGTGPVLVAELFKNFYKLNK